MLFVNHEYTNEHRLFPGIVKIVEGKINVAPANQKHLNIEMAAYGGSVVEICKDAGKWQVVRDSNLSRRSTSITEMQMTGQTACHDCLKTNFDA